MSAQLKRSSSVVSSDSSDEESPEKKPKVRAPPVATIFSQPVDTGHGFHTNTRMAYAVSALKDRKGNPVRVDDLATLSGWSELEWNQEFQDLLKKHERVQWDSKLNLFSYRTDHKISNPAELLQAIKINKDKSGGVSVNSLKESWPDAQPVLDELIAKGDVLPMRIKNDKYRQVFWNEIDLERGGRSVDKDFRDAWHALKLPMDVQKALVEEKLKPSLTDETEGPLKTITAKKGKKSGNRRVKITNTHMVSHGLDLSKDREIAE